ncbi:tripartite tricarboxylate transporter permease [Endozoicomonas numazuensis]|uniref:tripartite tricarboxylate transporter permease n=1 Tax=Endozoicomonas numazuensis TaxID=1137799 RepID=UPI002E802FD9|nr:tripartite tricarboxylate transporter permease [Endozoicomonas numazuensis]
MKELPPVWLRQWLGTTCSMSLLVVLPVPFTFGKMDLIDGIDFLLLAMATFALAEALMSVFRPDKGGLSGDQLGQMGSLKLSKEEVKEVVPTVARSSILGFFTGVLPGAGATIASFLAYGMERNLASAKKSWALVKAV